MKVKITLADTVSMAVRSLGVDFEVETDSHPREQLSEFQCIVARHPDGRELTIPAQAIAVVAIGSKK